MSRDSEATSECTRSIRMGSDDDLSSPRINYSFNDSSVSDRSLSSKSLSREANRSGRQPWKVILLDDWSIHDFPVDMSNEVFSRLRPHFQIPNNVPNRKGDSGEKCYDGKSSDVDFYEAMFIAGLCLPLSILHCQLTSYLGISVSQIASNAWRIFIGAKVL